MQGIVLYKFSLIIIIINFIFITGIMQRILKKCIYLFQIVFLPILGKYLKGSYVNFKTNPYIHVSEFLASMLLEIKNERLVLLVLIRVG